MSTKSFQGDGHNLKSLLLKKVEWKKDNDNKMILKELNGNDSEITLKADLVLLAMGFLHPKKDKLIKDLGIKLDDREMFMRMK